MSSRRVFMGVVALGALWSVIGCNRDYTPKRVAGVPESAVWSGGPDGGAWIECQLAPDGKSNPCKVWNDHTGDLLVKGDFRLEKELRAATLEELRYTGFDGSRIHLAGNRALVPLPGTNPVIEAK